MIIGHRSSFLKRRSLLSALHKHSALYLFSFACYHTPSFSHFSCLRLSHFFLSLFPSLPLSLTFSLCLSFLLKHSLSFYFCSTLLDLFSLFHSHKCTISLFLSPSSTLTHSNARTHTHMHLHTHTHTRTHTYTLALTHTHPHFLEYFFSRAAEAGQRKRNKHWPERNEKSQVGFFFFFYFSRPFCPACRWQSMVSEALFNGTTPDWLFSSPADFFAV